MGHLKGFSLHSQKGLNSGCLTYRSLFKKSPPKIYKLNCLTKVYTGHSILASYRLSRKFEVYNRNKSLSENKQKKQQIELNKENECFLRAQDHNISGRWFTLGDASSGLSVYTKERANLAVMLHEDTRIRLYSSRRVEVKRARIMIHMQVLKVDSEITVLYKIIIITV